MNGNHKSIAQYNLYAYCDNNPVNSKDDDGDVPTMLAGAIAGATIAGVSELVGQVINNSWSGVDYKKVMIQIAGGAVSGAVMGSGAGFLALFAANTGISATTTLAVDLYDKKNMGDIAWDCVCSGIYGFMSGCYGGEGAQAVKTINGRSGF